MLERLAVNLRGRHGGLGIDDIAASGDHRTVVIDDNCSVCQDFFLIRGNDTNHSIGDVIDEQAELWISAFAQCQKDHQSHNLIHLLS